MSPFSSVSGIAVPSFRASSSSFFSYINSLYIFLHNLSRIGRFNLYNLYNICNLYKLSIQGPNANANCNLLCRHNCLYICHCVNYVWEKLPLLRLESFSLALRLRFANDPRWEASFEVVLAPPHLYQILLCPFLIFCKNNYALFTLFN